MKEAPDANDTLRAKGTEGVRNRHDGAQKYNAGNVGPKAEKTVADRLLLFESAAVIRPQQVNWLWRGHLARGKLTLVAGEPGVGKSQLTLDVASRITAAADWPDEGAAPLGSVLILSAEDAADDTVVPRLEAAGANLERVHILQRVVDRSGKVASFSLQTDLDRLGKKIEQLGDVALVIVDPITSYMGGKVDSHRTTDVREVLGPVADFAGQHQVAVLAVSHPPKQAQGKAINSITGSLAFVAAARLVFIAIEEPGSDGRRLLLSVKNNLGARAAGLGYRVVQRFVFGDIVASHVAWDASPVNMTADEALAATSDEQKCGEAVREAADFLSEALSDGPRSASEVTAEAELLGIAPRTLKRARRKLHVVASKEGFSGGWVWQLPPEGGQA